MTLDILCGNFRKCPGSLREFPIVNEELGVEADRERDICPTAIHCQFNLLGSRAGLFNLKTVAFLLKCYFLIVDNDLPLQYLVLHQVPFSNLVESDCSKLGGKLAMT